MAYLKDIPWLNEARAEMVREAKEAKKATGKTAKPKLSDSAKFKVPKRKKKSKLRRKFN